MDKGAVLKDFERFSQKAIDKETIETDINHLCDILVPTDGYNTRYMKVSDEPVTVPSFGETYPNETLLYVTQTSKKSICGWPICMLISVYKEMIR